MTEYIFEMSICSIPTYSFMESIIISHILISITKIIIKMFIQHVILIRNLNLSAVSAIFILACHVCKIKYFNGMFRETYHSIDSHCHVQVRVSTAIMILTKAMT